jgi:uncharacterized protein (TIGR03067 family)
MRVNRAVDKLHGLLKDRGVTISAAALGTALTTQAVAAAPAGLAATISTAVLSGTTTTTTAVIAATKTIAMTTFQKALTTVAIVVALGVGIHEARRASALHNERQSLQQQQVTLREEIGRLQPELDDATGRLAGLREENQRLHEENRRLDLNTGQLLKLRAEVGRLKEALAATTQIGVTNTPVASDSARLQGTWKGQEPGREIGSVTQLIVSGSAWQFRGVDANQWFDGTFTLREDVNPRQLIVEITACPLPQIVGKKCYAIYSIEEDTLMLTSNGPENPVVPEGFSGVGSRQFVLHRTRTQ